jgi:dTDP-4-amino-4,6-dideoxygalactose transaminase
VNDGWSKLQKSEGLAVSSGQRVIRDIPFGRPIIGEAERTAVLEVLSGPILVHGPRATVFEDAFARWTGASHAVSASSCTAAMHLVYFALGLGANDEVIVPAQTHAATAHAVELTGAKAVFVDAERRTGNIDIGAIEAAITPRTRVIAIVHYLGVPVDMAAVNAIAKRHKLFVLEDCALAIGTRIGDTHAGLFGDVGCFSFYPVKHMTTAEGGMIVARDGDFANKLRHLRAFGVDRHMGERKIPGVYDVTALGFNYRMNEIEAAIGIEQVKRLDNILSIRSQNFAALDRALRAIPHVRLFEPPLPGMQNSHYCLFMGLDDHAAPLRFEIVKQLNKRGVGTSIYYPHPVPHMSYYRSKYGYSTDSFPNAAWISNNSIALPVGAHLGPEDMAYIAEVTAETVQELVR